MIPKSLKDIALEAEAFNRMLAEKPFHVQAEIIFVENFELPPEARRMDDFYPLIEARVVRIFRGGEVMQIGDGVSFRLRANFFHPIYGSNEPVFDYKSLRQIKYLELLLDGPHIAKLPRQWYSTPTLDPSCLTVINGPTDNPVFARRLPPEVSSDFAEQLPPVVCSNCNIVLPTGSKFCARCGAKLGTTA